MWRHLVIGFALSSLPLWAQKKAASPKEGTKDNAGPSGLVQFSKTEHDFGKIKEEDRSASTRFTFKNMQKAPVKIVDVKASCGCTTPTWSKDPIPPGKEGYVETQYEAWGRPGSFIKTVTVRIRSEADTTKEETYTLTIKGEVLPRPKGPEDWYPTKVGGLRFGPANHVSYGTIKTNEKKTQRITLYNDSEKPIELKGFADVPKHVEITFITPKGSVPSLELKPKDTVQVEVKYDAGAANDYGFIYHVLRIRTSDQIDQPDKPFYITANIEEYFGELTEAQLAEAPRAQFDRTDYDYGKIKAGEKVAYEFRLTNTGKKPLLIRKTKASCGCTVAAPDKSELKPGETTSIKVTFDSTGRSGRDSKSVTVITNDPRQPTINLAIHGEIEPSAK